MAFGEVASVYRLRYNLLIATRKDAYNVRKDCLSRQLAIAVFGGVDRGASIFYMLDIVLLLLN